MTVEQELFFIEQAERARCLRSGQTMEIWIEDIDIAFVNLSTRNTENIFIAMNDGEEWFHTTDAGNALTALTNALSI
jgi:hypothetical protein